MQQQLGMKTIQISSLSYLRSPQESKCQDNNREGDRLVTAEDGCQNVFPRIAECWVFLLRSESDKGVEVGCNKFSGAWDQQLHTAMGNATSQCGLTNTMPTFQVDAHRISPVVAALIGQCCCHSYWEYLKGRSQLLIIGLGHKGLPHTCLFSFLEYLWIFLRWDLL